MLLGHQRGSWGCLHRPQGMCRGSSKFTLENCKLFCGLKNWSKGCPFVVNLQTGAALPPKQTEPTPDETSMVIETAKVTCWHVICSLFLLNPGLQGNNSFWLLKGATNTNSDEVCVQFLFLNSRTMSWNCRFLVVTNLRREKRIQALGRTNGL